MSLVARVLPAALAALAALSLSVPPSATGAAGPAAAGPAAKKAKPKVEVVFCLDTTGSMTGLIDGAKAKIWAICNQIAGGKPTPDLKVGLVAYRDRGDEYITKVIDLTDDLDSIHSKLKTFVAAGGGDAPESVNQALYDSVHKVKWSKDAKTLRIIFLVGDAPPHMDYPDDVKYPVTCKEACKRGIIINTVQCGNDGECEKHWKEIARKAEGSYVQISQSGGVVAIATPFDKDLAKINSELVGSAVVYGGAGMRATTYARVEAARTLPAPAAADRGGFSGATGRVVTGDLLDDIKAKKVDLAKVKDADLPPELKKLKTPAERKAYLDKVEKRRGELTKQAADLNSKRQEFIKRELAKKGKGKDAFDNQVLEMLRRQARKHAIEY
jgi:Mg-chelatase subunit ChlD